MFGSKKQDVEKLTEVAEDIDWQPLIDAERAQLLQESAETFKKLTAAHDEDRRRFRISVERSGMFLTVRIERPPASALIAEMNERDTKYPARVGTWGDEPDSGIESRALNIAATRAIVVAKGRAPDEGGSTKILCSREGDSSWGDSSGRYGITPGSGAPYAYHTYYHRDPLLKAYRRFEDLQDHGRSPISPYFSGCDGGRKARSYHGPVRPVTEVTGLVRKAIDDRIMFAGINVAIHVPAGMGEAIRDQIVEASK